jgi:hypothetical protein
MIVTDTAALSRIPELAEGGPTSARNENSKLNEVSTTAVPSEMSKLHEVMYSDASPGAGL